jgi:hypothetical protein
MDLLHFLRERVRFVRYLYEATIPAFAETKRKIEAGEEPFVDRRCCEDADEPAFLAEWKDADLAIDVIGMTCLSMLQTAFRSFLKEYIKQVGGQKLLEGVSRIRKGSWFAKYRAFFKEELGVDWAASGVDLGFLEQMILTRNDFHHNADIFSGYVFQTKDHAEKYPDTAFRDSRWPSDSWLLRARLRVDRPRFEAAIEALEKLCEYLESLRKP